LNRLFRTVVLLGLVEENSHSKSASFRGAGHDDATTEDGEIVPLRPGITLTAFDDDADEHGRPDKILATGVVERSPDWLQCEGSCWVLRIDSSGIRHASGL
jgi:hypothetical protein